MLHRIGQPRPRPVQYVSEMLDHLLLSNVSPRCTSASVTSSLSLHRRIQELIQAIKPYIFGDTPMCMWLNDAEAVFRPKVNRKILFIVSDRLSTDGDPRPIAQKLRESGVTIVTCFLTSDNIHESRRLFDEVDPSWKDGRSVLFARMNNTHTPISYLVDANWHI